MATSSQCHMAGPDKGSTWPNSDLNKQQRCIQTPTPA